jgi:hypothetical protein
MTADLFGFQPSPQQAAFLDFAASGKGNAVLEACAGAGKTSTLTHGVGRMRGGAMTDQSHMMPSYAASMRRWSASHSHFCAKVYRVAWQAVMS